MGQWWVIFQNTFKKETISLARLVMQRSSPTGELRDETKTAARETKKLSTYSPMKTVLV